LSLASVRFGLAPTFISYAIGWTSGFRQPIQKPIRITDDENKN